jgi:hypothetical protein
MPTLALEVESAEGGPKLPTAAVGYRCEIGDCIRIEAGRIEDLSFTAHVF